MFTIASCLAPSCQLLFDVADVIKCVFFFHCRCRVETWREKEGWGGGVGHPSFPKWRLIVSYCGPLTQAVSPSSWQVINKRKVALFRVRPRAPRRVGPEAAAASHGAARPLSASCVICRRRLVQWSPTRPAVARPRPSKPSVADE